MRHEDMPLQDRAKEALARIKCGHGQMRIPAEATDPDMVIAALLAEVERLEADYGGACKLVAQMHAAAIGGKVGDGPRLGVLEDVAATRAERDNLAQSADLLKAVAERAGAERDAALADAARLRAALAAIAGETSVLVRSDGSATRNGDRLTMTRSLCDIRDTARAALESK